MKSVYYCLILQIKWRSRKHMHITFFLFYHFRKEADLNGTPSVTYS